MKKHLLDYPEAGLDGEGGNYPNGHLSATDRILMQFTGLKDKNGKEAYWDDIASDGINPPFVIEFDYPLLARLSGIPFEVIGNIYENPELMDK